MTWLGVGGAGWKTGTTERIYIYEDIDNQSSIQRGRGGKFTREAAAEVPEKQAGLHDGQGGNGVAKRKWR